MQIKKIVHSVLISVPVGDLLEAGIDTNKMIETCVSDGKLIIQNADETSEYICEGDCENCPIRETDCDGDCKKCPCNEYCDDSEVI